MICLTEMKVGVCTVKFYSSFRRVFVGWNTQQTENLKVLTGFHLDRQGEWPYNATGNSVGAIWPWLSGLSMTFVSRSPRQEMRWDEGWKLVCDTNGHVYEHDTRFTASNCISVPAEHSILCTYLI